MSIRYDEREKTLTLETKSASYQMKIDKYDFLHHLYYGRNVGNADMSYMFGRYDRGFSGNPYITRDDRGFSLDTIPQEYPSFGVGDYRINGISVVNGDGSYCAEFHYVGHEVKKGKYSIPGLPAVYDNGGEAETLIVKLKDQVTGLAVKLYYGIFYDADVITRSSEIINEGSEEIILEKAASACLDIPFGSWDVIHFHGRHTMECQLERTPVTHSVKTISSNRGISSHQHNPFVILCDRNADEDHGDCYGVMLMYSGNHMTEIELDQFDNTRIVTGINDAQFRWLLTPNSSFYTPDVIMTYSSEGLTKLSHNYHHIIRNNVCRGKYKNARRPVLLNSWEACYFDINEEKLLTLAGQASELGIEMFVLDDGWFNLRNDDNAGLGDWFVNTNKLPHGLSYIADKVNELGMKFGIWIEPEMVNEHSELYRAHPDWAFAAPNRAPMLGRNQLVLDMSREDVQEYLYAALSKLLRENNIEYVKWDMNRALADVYSYSSSKETQGEIGHRYVLGMYKLMDRLTSEFPDVLFEGCSGGGGRFDAGILYYSPQIWCSDDTDPIARLKIQHGTSFGYPISAVGAHVSASPNHQTGRTTPINTRAVVAMSGTFGYELDINKLTEEEKSEIRRQIVDFKRYYDVIQSGKYYRLTLPKKGLYYEAWQFVSPDRSESLVNLVVTSVQPNAAVIHIRLKGLDPKGHYEDGDGHVYSGAALMYGGYSFPLLGGDYPAVQIYLKKVDEA